jgi:hypothetical protein
LGVDFGEPTVPKRKEKDAIHAPSNANGIFKQTICSKKPVNLQVNTEQCRLRTESNQQTHFSPKWSAKNQHAYHI